MGESLLNKALSYFRIDGPWEAPIKFLTIEDGEGYTDNDLESKESFSKVLDKSGQLIIREGETFDGRAGFILGGRPGVYISKIMADLAPDANKDWDRYRRKILYRKNEANLKFYPLALKSIDYWPDELKNHLGIELETYRQYCQLLRPGFIAKKFNEHKHRTKIFIIMGAYYEWLTVLGQTLSGIDPGQILPRSIPFNNNKSKFRFWQFKDQDGVQITWAHFPVFTRGLCDDDVPRFCDELRNLVPGIAAGLSTDWSQA